MAERMGAGAGSGEAKQEQYLDAELRRCLPRANGFTCPEQRSIAHAFYRGRPADVLGILPTGKGKSLCHLLPTHLWKTRRRSGTGLTVVVTPILALMQDQVDALASERTIYGKLKLVAEQLNSTVDLERRRNIRRRLTKGAINVLYLGPEAFVQPWNYEALATAAENGHLRGLVIDEAHMVAEWGDEFRTSFKRLAPVREILRKAMPKGDKLRTLVMTATLPASRRKEVLESLGLDEGIHTVELKEVRDEHVLSVVKARNHAVKLDQLVKDARRLTRRGAGIIYCNQKKHCEEIVDLLSEKGLGPAKWYHGGTGRTERREVLRMFRRSSKLTVVATDAFGLGVDKRDVRWVLHFSHPDSLDQYYQEIGRGGRDGKSCEALLYYCPADKGQGTRNALKVLTTDKFKDRIDSLEAGAAHFESDGGRIHLLDEVTLPGYIRDKKKSRKKKRTNSAQSLKLHAGWNYASLVRAEELEWLRLGPDVLYQVECRLGRNATPERLRALAPLVHSAGLLDRMSRRTAGTVDISRAAKAARASPLVLQREIFRLIQSGCLAPAEGSSGRWMQTRVMVRDLLGRRRRRVADDAALRLRRQRKGAAKVDEMAVYAKSSGCRRRHFYQTYDYPSPASTCGVCDNCRRSVR